MAAIFRYLKKYPASIIFYLLYTFLCYILLKMSSDFHERIRLNPGKSGIMLGGEGVGMGGVILVAMCGLFLLITFANAIGQKAGPKFYLFLGALIVIQTILTFKLANTL